MKNLSKFHERITIQQETCWSTCNIKIVINSDSEIYQDKKIPLSLNKLISQKKLEENNGAITFFITEKQQKAILNFSSELLIIAI